MRRLWILSFCWCIISCADRHPAHPVRGKLLINSKPAADADIMLYHQGDWGETRIEPYAHTKADGTFALSTYAENDGAPVGEYNVRVTWPIAGGGPRGGPDRMQGKYADPRKTPLKVTINKETTELPTFELTADILKLPEPAPAAAKEGDKAGKTEQKK
jgi:hypothetical protein